MGLLGGLGMLGGGLANALGLGLEGYSKDVETKAKRERDRIADLQAANALGLQTESHKATMGKLQREADVAKATDVANRLAYDRLPVTHRAKTLPYDPVQPYTQLGLDYGKTEDTEKGIFGALEAYRNQPNVARVLDAKFNLQQAGSYKPYLEAAQKSAADAADLERAREAARLRPKTDGMTLSGLSTLRGQFNQEKSYQRSDVTAEGVRRMRAAATDPSPAGDLALLYGWNNVLDPDSIVKEGELATAAKAGKLSDQVTAAVLRVTSGTRLTPEMRADFVQRAEKLAQARREQFHNTLERYRGIATRVGVNPDDVVTDPYAGLFDPTPDAAGAGGGGSSGNINFGAKAGAPKIDAGAWKAANPKRDNESVQQWYARFQAATGQQ